MQNKIKDFLETLGINITLAIAGFIGSLIWATTTDDKSIKKGLIGIFSGTFCANYITPLVIDVFNLGEESQFGVAFVLGYTGLKGVERLADKYFKKK